VKALAFAAASLLLLARGALGAGVRPPGLDDVRSVAVVEELASRLRAEGHNLSAFHRDIHR